MDNGVLLGRKSRPAVLVLGAGGLARQLVVGPLHEHGVRVVEAGATWRRPVLAADDDGQASSVPAGEGFALPGGTGPDTLDLRGAGAGERAGVGPVAVDDLVGLLVNPTTEHWNAAVAERIPLILVLMDRLSDEEVVDAVLRGVDAVVTAHDDPEDLLHAIEVVLEGGTLLSPQQCRSIAGRARGQRFDSLPMDALTRRELEILQSIDRGETVKQTARALGISAKTVENLQSRLFRKLGVRNRAQAVSRAHALGMLGAPPD